jgi:hypothetical protein
LYEAATGRVPVRGAGYRGRFTGEGWDSMWTDMSEIVRPTRDGIHGREYISTSVDIGGRPDHLEFDRQGQVVGETPRSIALPIPFLLDVPPKRSESDFWSAASAEAARRAQTFCLTSISPLLAAPDRADVSIPLLTAAQWPVLRRSRLRPAMVELEGWDEAVYRSISTDWPQTLIAVRLPYGAPLLDLFARGARIFHLVADYHGRAAGGFVLEAAGAAHRSLVRAGVREQVTLIGSGGITAAEHVPKALIAGLDLVALDTPLWIAVQARFEGEVTDRESAELEWTVSDPGWAAARLANLMASWRDQLLEVLGAMGLREVRRLRGETGRAMFHADLEREAFAGIPGYPEAANG